MGGPSLRLRVALVAACVLVCQIVSAVGDDAPKYGWGRKEVGATKRRVMVWMCLERCNNVTDAGVQQV